MAQPTSTKQYFGRRDYRASYLDSLGIRNSKDILDTHLGSTNVDVVNLKKICFQLENISHGHRQTAWKLFLGAIPACMMAREFVLSQKRQEYADLKEYCQISKCKPKVNKEPARDSYSDTSPQHTLTYGIPSDELEPGKPEKKQRIREPKLSQIHSDSDDDKLPSYPYRAKFSALDMSGDVFEVDSRLLLPDVPILSKHRHRRKPSDCDMSEGSSDSGISPNSMVSGNAPSVEEDVFQAEWDTGKPEYNRVVMGQLLEASLQLDNKHALSLEDLTAMANVFCQLYDEDELTAFYCAQAFVETISTVVEKKAGTVQSQVNAILQAVESQLLTFLQSTTEYLNVYHQATQMWIRQAFASYFKVPLIYGVWDKIVAVPTAYLPEYLACIVAAILQQHKAPLQQCTSPMNLRETLADITHNPQKKMTRILAKVNEYYNNWVQNKTGEAT